MLADTRFGASKTGAGCRMLMPKIFFDMNSSIGQSPLESYVLDVD